MNHSSLRISHRCKIAFPHRVGITAVLYRLEMRTRLGVRVHFNEAVCAPRQRATVTWVTLVGTVFQFHSNFMGRRDSGLQPHAENIRMRCCVLCTEYCWLLTARSRCPLHTARNFCIQFCIQQRSMHGHRLSIYRSYRHVRIHKSGFLHMDAII